MAGATGKDKRRRKRRGRPKGKTNPLKTFRRTWNVFSEKQTKRFRGILCAWARSLNRRALGGHYINNKCD